MLRTNPIFYLFGMLWRFSKGNRPRVVFYCVFILIATAIGMLEPFIIAKLLDVVQFEGVTQANISFILFLASLFIAVQFAFWAFWYPARVTEISNAFRVRAHYKLFLLEGTLDLPAAWHTDHHSGDTIDKIEKGTTNLFRFSSDTFQVIQGFVKLLFSFGVLLYFNVHSGLVVAVMVTLTIVMILKLDERIIEQYERLNQAENGIAAKIFDVISNVTTVIILRIEKLVAKTIAKKIHLPYDLFVKNTKLNELKWMIVSVAVSVMVFLVLSVYFVESLYSGAAIAVGTVYLLWSYVMRVADVFYNFAYQYGDIVQQKTAVMNSESLAVDFQGKKNIAAIRTGSTWRDLNIRDLSFSYHAEDDAAQHLDHVSMDIKRGERIALIGESGSGKTTLLKILRGLYSPKSAVIELDGKPLRYGVEMLSAQIALIPQDPEIFATTIRENITMGVDHTMSTLKKFTDMARFTNVVERLPKQWESSIVEKGVNLSGGEKQRLALARGLLACADKSIVLLDEPTSSVDMKNEAMIYEGIFKAFKDKTVISSIHRLHLLHLFDTIYFFENGKIIESGSLNELLKTSKKFQELWRKYQETQDTMREEM